MYLTLFERIIKDDKTGMQQLLEDHNKGIEHNFELQLRSDIWNTTQNITAILQKLLTAPVRFQTPLVKATKAFANTYWMVHPQNHLELVNQIAEDKRTAPILTNLWRNPEWAGWHTTRMIARLLPSYIQDNLLDRISRTHKLDLVKTRWQWDQWTTLVNQPELQGKAAIKEACRRSNQAAMALIATLQPNSVTYLSRQQREHYPGIEKMAKLAQHPNADPQTCCELLSWPNTGGMENPFWPFEPIGLNKEKCHQQIKTHNNTSQTWPAIGEVRGIPNTELNWNSFCITTRSKTPHLVAIRISEKHAVINQNTSIKHVASAAHILERANVNQHAIKISLIEEQEILELQTKNIDPANQFLRRHLARNTFGNGQDPTNNHWNILHSRIDNQWLQLLQTIEPEVLDTGTRACLKNWAKYVETLIIHHPDGIPVESHTPTEFLRCIIRIGQKVDPEFRPEAESLSRLL